MAKIQLKRSLTQATWEASSIILAPGEPGVALDTGAVRFGDGTRTWSQLPAGSIVNTAAVTDSSTYRFTEGVPLYSYGHSYTMYPSPYTTPLTGEYMERVRQRLSMGTGYFRGRSGTPLMDTLCGALSPNFIPPSGSSGTRTWVPNSRGIVLIENYMNESSGAAGGIAKYREGWKHALRTMIALTGTASKLTSSAAVRAGTWTKLVTGADRFSDADTWFSSTVNSTMTFSVTGDTCWVVGVVSDIAYNSGALEVKVGSTVLTTIVTQDKTDAFVSSVDGATKSYTPTAFKITGMNAAAGTTGAKNLVIRVVEAKNTFVNCILVPMSNPPHVYVAKEPTRNPAGTNQASVTSFNANRAAFELMVDQVCAEFPQAHVVNLETGWDNSTMVASLDVDHNFHPNDLGMQCIADNFVTAVKSTITGPVKGVMTL